MDALFTLFLYIFRKIREFVLINRKILVVLHIVNVEVHAVERNFCIIVALDYAVNGLTVGVTPTALLVAECPERRNVALTDCRTKFLYNVNRLVALGFYYIDVKIRAVNGDVGAVCRGVADVPADSCGKVNENTKILTAVEHKEIVCGIE